MPEPRAVSVALQKGGVGKTTLAINLAERLANRGNDVLLVDLDQQGDATEGLGLDAAYASGPNFGDVLDPERDVDVETVIHETEWFDVLPSHESLSRVESAIRDASFGQFRVREAVVDPLLGDVYDYVVVDTPPKIGPLSDASLVATGNVVVPLRPAQPSLSGFERMVDQQLDPLGREVDLDVLAIVPNGLQGDGEDWRVIEHIENSAYADCLPLFARSSELDHDYPPGPGIRKRVAFRRAWRDGVPLAAHDPDNDMLDRLDKLAAVVEHGGVGERMPEAFPDDVTSW